MLENRKQESVGDIGYQKFISWEKKNLKVLGKGIDAAQ